MFGTIGFIAPEVLMHKPYSFSCDVWSIGCIMYALIAGALPFDSHNDRETKRMTVEEPLEFEEDVWQTVSSDCKDLILKLLTKDSNARISLDKALQHKYFEGLL